MRKRIFAAIVLTGLFIAVLVPGKLLAAACDNTIKGSLQCGTDQSSGVPTSPQDQTNLNDTIGTIINDISIVVGIVSVVMITIGGFRFATSGGDSSKVSSAKSTVIYALIGLAVAVLAQVIARFVIGKAIKL